MLWWLHDDGEDDDDYDDGPTEKGNWGNDIMMMALLTKGTSPSCWWRSSSLPVQTPLAPLSLHLLNILILQLYSLWLMGIFIHNYLYWILYSLVAPLTIPGSTLFPRTQLCKSVTTDTTDRGLKPLALPSLVVVYIAKDLHWPLTLIVHVCFSTAIAPIVIYYSHPVALCSEADL